MEYISTRNSKKTFLFKDVFLKGLASDGGLFIPKTIPSYTYQELEKLKNLSYGDLAAEIIMVKAIFPPLLSVIQTVQR